MTLNLLLVTPEAGYLSSDFRITYTKGGFSDDPPTQKLIVLFRRDWSALVSFAGVAETEKVNVAAWLAEQTGKIPVDGRFEDLETVLRSADGWLASLGRDSWLTFSVVAFVFRSPVAMLVSNYQYLDGREEAAPLGNMIASREESEGPIIFIGGRRKAVRGTDRKMLEHLPTFDPNHLEVHRALAYVNGRAAEADSAISPACFTAHLVANGDATAYPHGVRDDLEYLPKFTTEPLENAGVQLRAQIDAHGKPKPRRLISLSYARSVGTQVTVKAPPEIADGDLMFMVVDKRFGAWMSVFRNVESTEEASGGQA